MQNENHENADNANNLAVQGALQEALHSWLAVKMKQVEAIEQERNKLEEKFEQFREGEAADLFSYVHSAVRERIAIRPDNLTSSTPALADTCTSTPMTAHTPLKRPPRRSILPPSRTMLSS